MDGFEKNLIKNQSDINEHALKALEAAESPRKMIEVAASHAAKAIALQSAIDKYREIKEKIAGDLYSHHSGTNSPMS